MIPGVSPKRLGRILAARAEVTAVGLALGAVLGAGAALAALAGPLSRPPVRIIDAASYRTEARVRDGGLELHVKLLRTSSCNSTSQLWLWRWDGGDGLLDRARYFVPIDVNLITVAGPSPLIQDIIVAHALPAAVTPGRWFVKIKYADYCHLLAVLFGPSLRESGDIPVDVPDDRRGAAR